MVNQMQKQMQSDMGFSGPFRGICRVYGSKGLMANHMKKHLENDERIIMWV